MRTILYDRTQGSQLLYTTWTGAYRSSSIESLRPRIVTFGWVTPFNTWWSPRGLRQREPPGLQTLSRGAPGMGRGPYGVGPRTSTWRSGNQQTEKTTRATTLRRPELFTEPVMSNNDTRQHRTRRQQHEPTRICTPRNETDLWYQKKKNFKTSEEAEGPSRGS